MFAGKDATRSLATFSLSDEIKDGYDDISDLSSVQMDSVREWEEQFTGLFLIMVFIDVKVFFFNVYVISPVMI